MGRVYAVYGNRADSYREVREEYFDETVQRIGFLKEKPSKEVSLWKPFRASREVTFISKETSKEELSSKEIDVVILDLSAFGEDEKAEQKARNWCEERDMKVLGIESLDLRASQLASRFLITK